MQKWEERKIQQRAQFKTNIPHLEVNKEPIILEQLMKKPLIELDELEQVIKLSGLQSLSLKEKIKVLYRQYSLLLLYKYNYEQKLQK